MAGLCVFRIAGKQDMPTWGWLVRLVRHWERIERTIEDHGEGPWFCAVNEQGLSEIGLRSVGT